MLYHTTQGRCPVSTPVSRPRSQSARSHGSLILLVSGPGERGPGKGKKKSRAATLVAMVPVEVRYRGGPDGGGGSGQTQQHASRISSLEDDPWGPRYAQMHRRSGLRSIWIFDLAPAGMRAPLVRLTPATKSGSQYLPSWTRRSADVTVAARTSFVFGD